MSMTIQPVECWLIPPSKALDAIHVFWMDTAPGAGYVTITCCGSAWTACFGAMCLRTIRQFVASCDTEYMVSAMAKRDHAYLARIIDAVKEEIRKNEGE